MPGASTKRTKAGKTTLRGQVPQGLRAAEERRQAARQDQAGRRAPTASIPMHIVGAIVGEHTYNVDAYDRLQTYYVKAVSYLEQPAVASAMRARTSTDFVARPQFAGCDGVSGSYELWTCRERVWNRVLPRQDGRRHGLSRRPLQRHFFQPFYAGQTFGLGQLNPLTALQMSDLVHQRLRPAAARRRRSATRSTRRSWIRT